MLLIEWGEGNWRVLHRGEAQALGRGCVSNCGMESFMYRNKALSLSEDEVHRVSAAHRQVMTRPTSLLWWFLLDLGRFFWVAGSSRMV